jgi:NADH-quinone oxidoreductase subunit C
MKETEINEKLLEKFPDIKTVWMDGENGDNHLTIPHDKITEIVTFLKDTWELSFDYLMNVSAFDNGEQIEVTYHLNSYRHQHSLVLKVKVAREGGVVDTLALIYGTANFQEREVFDHFGVKFKGHPDLRRILLPEDWVGYPLLKDYEEQEEYNGIGTTRPSML